MLSGLLITLDILVCIALVAIVLLQRSEGGAFGMGGGPTGLVTARGAGDLLTRTTWILFGLFLALSIGLTLLGAHDRASSSVIERLKLQQANPNALSQPIAPPPGAPQPGAPQPGAPLTAPATAPGAPLIAPAPQAAPQIAPQAAPAPATQPAAAAAQHATHQRKPAAEAAPAQPAAPALEAPAPKPAAPPVLEAPAPQPAPATQP
jgi:preprotein translocase subunit SecG